MWVIDDLWNWFGEIISTIVESASLLTLGVIYMIAVLVFSWLILRREN